MLLMSSRAVDGSVLLKMFFLKVYYGLFYLYISTFTFREELVKLRRVLNMPGVFDMVDEIRSLDVPKTFS